MSDLPKPNIFRLLLEIAIFVAVVVADVYGLIPITQTIFLLPLVWIMLRLRGERWSDFGFARPDSFGKAIVIGVLAGVLMELFAH
ncbi:MAG: hypothetical protein WBD27_18690 [Pyrinomonadaceae bacterium]